MQTIEDKIVSEIEEHMIYIESLLLDEEIDDIALERAIVKLKELKERLKKEISFGE